MSARATASHVVQSSADEIFDALTDISRLPAWNTTITSVLSKPDTLDVGNEWVVEMHALGQRWPSRSRVEEHDPIRRRFAYRSCTDDGNPSYALWAWEVTDHPEGALVSVAFDLCPRSFWRRILFAKIRARQLVRTEIPGSLAALEKVARPSSRQG